MILSLVPSSVLQRVANNALSAVVPVTPTLVVRVRRSSNLTTPDAPQAKAIRTSRFMLPSQSSFSGSNREPCVPISGASGIERLMISIAVPSRGAML
jgi:hypothetical protein